MKLLGLVASAFLLLPVTNAALAEDAPLTVDALRGMTQDELDATYLSAKAGTLPNGESQGTAVFFPNSDSMNSPTQRLAGLVWQGKVFDTDEGILVNKVFGFKAIKAKVYYGESLLDGNESIIIDYHDTSLLARQIRDEIRQVAENLYLGRAYFRSPLGDAMVVNFILDFSGN